MIQHSGFKRAALLVACFSPPAYGQDTIRIASYNLLNYPDTDATTRNPHFRRALSVLDPDILAWFIWRWINKKFGRDIHRELNWFNANIICSGLIFDFWIYVGMGMIMPSVMSQYHPSTIAPADILEIERGNPNIFSLVERKP